LRKRVRFGVRVAGAMVIAFADDMPFTNDECADRRIRRRVADAAGSQLVGPL
jgi:hypothetical protein